MTLQRIEQIESRVRESDKMPEDAKAELLAELAALKAEITPLISDESLALPAEVEGIEGGPIQPVVRELAESVQGFEASHPQLTQMVNRIAVVLSNMGI